MTLSGFHSILNEAGLPIAYRSFKQAVTPPFIVYGQGIDADFIADNTHYTEIFDGFLELYTDKKDIDSERQIAQALAGSGVVWARENEDYIPDQRLYYVRWSIQFIMEV